MERWRDEEMDTWRDGDMVRRRNRETVRWRGRETNKRRDTETFIQASFPSNENSSNVNYAAMKMNQFDDLFHNWISVVPTFNDDKKS